MDKKFLPTLHWACDYLSILILKSTHVSKRGPGTLNTGPQAAIWIHVPQWMNPSSDSETGMFLGLYRTYTYQSQNCKFIEMNNSILSKLANDNTFRSTMLSLQACKGFRNDNCFIKWFWMWSKMLTHWGRVTHICVSKVAIIVSNNGLSPGRQAIIWTNAGILLIWPLGTNFSEISIDVHTFSFKKIPFKMSSGKCRPFCLGLNVFSRNS